jgi:hypothetical protein
MHFQEVEPGIRARQSEPGDSCLAIAKIYNIQKHNFESYFDRFSFVEAT